MKRVQLCVKICLEKFTLHGLISIETCYLGVGVGGEGDSADLHHFLILPVEYNIKTKN